MSDSQGAVFLSYASEDAEAAQRIAGALQAAGIEVWFDRNELRGGDEWDRRIRRQIRQCGLFLPVISQNTQLRTEGYFRLEWKLAIERTHLIADDLPFLAPVAIAAVAVPDALVPDRFRDLQWLRCPAGAVSEADVARIRELLQTRVPGALYRPAGAVAAGAVAARDRTSSAPHTTLLLVSIGVLALLLALAWWRFGVSAHRSAGAQLQPAAMEPPNGSVAVLPFADQSPAHDQEFLARGLTEELIGLLAQVPELRVSGRTSSYHYQATELGAAQIGRELAVRYLLRGSVATGPHAVSVHATLIRARDETPIWSRNYQQVLDATRAVPAEVAHAVAGALRIQVLPMLRVATQTQNSSSYEQFLRGREHVAHGDPEDFRAAVGNFRQAIALDGKFAAAYVGLAEARWLLDFSTEGMNPQEYREIIALLDHAIALDNQLADAYSERGVDRLDYAGDVDGAQSDLLRAVTLEPRIPRYLRRYGHLLNCRGAFDDSIAYARESVALDPFDIYALVHLAETLVARGEYDQAASTLTRARAMNPVFLPGLYDQIELHIIRNDLERARALLAEIVSPHVRAYYSAVIAARSAGAAHSRAAVDNYIRIYGNANPKEVADIYAWGNEPESALKWLQRTASISPGDLACMAAQQQYASLLGDRRLQAIMAGARVR